MNRFSVLGQTVLDARRNLSVSGAAHQAVALERSQLLGEHLRGDTGESALEIREAARLSLEEQKDDVELPAAAEPLESGSDVRCRSVGAEAFLT
jgi:hypothetical protein